MGRLLSYALGAFAIVAVAFGAGYAAGQSKPPSELRGVKIDVLRGMDLAKEIEGGAGRTLRLRRVTIEPGGATPLHDHVGRPEVTYIMQGRLVVHQEGQPDEVRNAGDSGVSGMNTKGGHWAENQGTVPAVFIAVDIAK